MNSFSIGNLSVGAPSDPVFIIAEIGQNHQGNVMVAKQIINEAKNVGCNSVKFQKSSLSAKFTNSALIRSYRGNNSWGTSYGQHKEYIEFSIHQYKELQEYCNEIGILFSASAMDETSLDELSLLNLPYIKIGSGDANNFQLIKRAAKLDCPLIISTGMQMFSTIEKIVNIMKTVNKTNYGLLHCVSSYPTKSENCNLLSIQLLKQIFPGLVIGYSGHELPIKTSLAAVLLGAKIIERHITLDKSLKGSDHICSLTPAEFSIFIETTRKYQTCELLRNPQSVKLIIRLLNSDKEVRKSLRLVKIKRILDCEIPCRLKLGKSLVTSTSIKKGEKLSLANIAIKVSQPFGLAAEHIELYLGKSVNTNMEKDEPLQYYNIVKPN